MYQHGDTCGSHTPQKPTNSKQRKCDRIFHACEGRQNYYCLEILLMPVLSGPTLYSSNQSG